MKKLQGLTPGEVENHIKLEELQYCKIVKKWLIERYGREKAIKIWKKTKKQYNRYLIDLPDYGGKKNGHAMAIYGGILIFSLYPNLPDQPPISEIQDFVNDLFYGPFTKLGNVTTTSRECPALTSGKT